MSQLRAAVIGVGYLGRFHAQKYKMISDVNLVAVCDADSERARKVAEELGVQSVTQYSDLAGKIDIATIAASTRSHYELAKFCLENQISVFVEKPITATSQEAELLCALAEKNNLTLQVGHIERFNPAMASARRVMTTPLFIEAHRLAPFNPRGADVNVVLDLMIHDLDVILSLVPSRVSHVAAVGAPVLTRSIDIANARIEFESGTVVNVTASRVSLQAQRKFRVFEKDKYLSIDFGQGRIDLTTKIGEGSDSPDGMPRLDHESWSLEKGDALLEETNSFVGCVRQKKTPLVSGRDGMAALKLAESIVERIEERKVSF